LGRGYVFPPRLKKVIFVSFENNFKLGGNKKVVFVSFEKDIPSPKVK
jgi:hypothetical protein